MCEEGLWTVVYVSYVWPDGYQDRLRAAGDAWAASSAALDDAATRPAVGPSDQLSRFTRCMAPPGL